MTKTKEAIFAKLVDDTKAVDTPLSGNPLQTRTDLQTAARALFNPLKPHFSPGAARVRLAPLGSSKTADALRAGLMVTSPFAGSFSNALAQRVLGRQRIRRWQETLRKPGELEGFARPLWGLVPLAAGGGSFEDWELYRLGLTHGTDPKHPEYWGGRLDRSQMLVEMAAIGFGLALVPEHLWEPLSPRVQDNVVRWLGHINTLEVSGNNWLFFRVLVNLGLERVGARHDAVAMEHALDRLDTLYLGDGWYKDGPKGQRDYYVAFALHYYGLIYAKLAEQTDPERAQYFRQRAADFAGEFVYWFSENGAALPFGRSLTYRFAQGAFWGALAFADVEALPWPVLKGLMLRHLRWWAQQPIFVQNGLLSVGYTYPNSNVAEGYSSPGSPYWAMKMFLPLALSESHPFWQAHEAPLPPLDPVRVQRQPGMAICHDSEHNHVFALSARQYAPAWVEHGPAKYAKFAYSSTFGFSVSKRRTRKGYELRQGLDSTLALSKDGRYYQVRTQPLEFSISGEVLYTRWSLWPEMDVETWLIPCLPWYVRVHRLRTTRRVYSAEGGFALGYKEEPAQPHVAASAGQVLASVGVICSGVRSLDHEGTRLGKPIWAEKDTNLLHRYTVIPTLTGVHEAGDHWLGCAVLGLPRVTETELERLWGQPPTLEFRNNGPVVLNKGRSFEFALP